MGMSPSHPIINTPNINTVANDRYGLMLFLDSGIGHTTHAIISLDGQNALAGSTSRRIHHALEQMGAPSHN
jgi:hypothetical protein